MIFLRLNKEKRKSPLAPGHQASAEATPGVRSWMSPGNAQENRDKLFHLRAEAKAGVRTHSSRMGGGGHMWVEEQGFPPEGKGTKNVSCSGKKANPRVGPNQGSQPGRPRGPSHLRFPRLGWGRGRTWWVGTGEEPVAANLWLRI